MLEAVMLNPESLEFHENAFQNMAQVREIVASDMFRLPIVVREISSEGNALRIVDGHHRAEIARQAGEEVLGIVIPFTIYEAMEEKGFDAIEIAYAACVAAEEEDAVEGIRGQFPHRSSSFRAAADALEEIQA